MIPVDVAELAGTIAETALYGVFVVLFMTAMHFSLARQGVKPSKVMLSVAISMAILATAQLGADITNIFLAFIDRERAQRIAFLQDVTQPIFILKHATLIAMMFLSDLFVTYRCWLIWHKNIWVVLLPICLSLGSGGVGTYTLWAFRNSEARTRAAQEWTLIAISSLSLGANVISTLLSALRIWNNRGKNAKTLGTMKLNVAPIVRIIIESGALNAAYMVANTVTWLTGYQGLTVELGTSLIGCIFMLMIIRICANARQEINSKSSIALRSLPRPRIEDISDNPPSTTSRTSRRIIVGAQSFVIGNDAPQSISEDGKPDAEFAL
ncbi:hypothetical protein NEOLEDRAFT_1120706 [Neolentinus lepideus HHB14362 ss-1]|uniref:Uncharacterized protein n=1 Tax=Neolentinus lepideus HHB14362 ss-1 TaxID=1314782 RepID=A0A165Q105_9AGAM|nr:hypothetical protein NEOLEDRAFT_1120706 [Neolentinus lepideus HHB14362 ss-1]